MEESVKILIYTDGSALGNPGPGGYGIVMKTSDGKFDKEFSKGFRLTTNNRMELMAVIDALKKIKNADMPIEIYSDSKYVVDSINHKWINRWKSTGYRKVKNPDLWRDFIKTAEGLNYRVFWVKGHNNHPENERCDRLAVKAAKENPSNVDEGYEKSKEDPWKLF